MDCIQLACDRVEWQAVIDTVMNPRFLLKAGNILRNTVNLQESIMRHAAVLQSSMNGFGIHPVGTVAWCWFSFLIQYLAHITPILRALTSREGAVSNTSTVLQIILICRRPTLTSTATVAIIKADARACCREFTHRGLVVDMFN